VRSPKQRFTNAPPGGTQGLIESTVSDYRFVIRAGESLTFDDNPEVLSGISSPARFGDASGIPHYNRHSAPVERQELD